MSNLSDMVKLYLAVNGIEQKSLCDELGIGQSTMTRFLQGKDISMKSLGKLLRWLTEDVKH
jgi:transcriptional regulator with XRE-family HTH domain